MRKKDRTLDSKSLRKAWLIASPRNDILRPLPFSLSLCNGWGGSRRSEAYRHADHQIRDWAPSQRFDGMAHPRALMNNKNQSPGWLVSLVIGDYLAWFGEHLLG
ncbi:hypothetical protein V8G54_032598 [Vigna mungo]|uniref:Uncharacterized protein n=1 Tax=Vigna mungo TaxID=3915 RepID=A0AAQ3MMD8_VIGMU